MIVSTLSIESPSAQRCAEILTPASGFIVVPVVDTALRVSELNTAIVTQPAENPCNHIPNQNSEIIGELRRIQWPIWPESQHAATAFEPQKRA